MNKFKHNKKRNIGIIYELLLRHMSNALIEGDKLRLKYATKLIEKRFNKHSELFKEFKVFNAISNISSKRTEIAAALILESKNSCKIINEKKLEKEKRQLIHDINHNIVPFDKHFYYRSLDNYRDLGTIQLALNEWKKQSSGSIRKIIEIEEKIIDIITKDKNKIDFNNHIEMLKESESNKLIYKIMTEKINNKYESMSSRQKKILKAYALEDDRNNYLQKTLIESKNECFEKINQFQSTNKNNYLSKKINEVKNKITNLDAEDINDQSIIKFLTVTKLIEELEE